ncbi:uncharacterized protein LOC117107893 [Anneissia japonica]|uniref:uncharacterized protein LOC117107893 n=1 Tax=Anneissia japonica TaxID=1529436 RepID=UPI001425967A|nr:uncharacterized protein LOC117107893 [Anneissia japonica]
MQERVLLEQNEAENDDTLNEQADLEHQKRISEPVGSVSGNINDDFVPMSMSSVNPSVRDALVKMGETQLGCNPTSPGGNINGEKMISHPIEQSLSKAKSSIAGECKASSHRSKRFADDSKNKRSRTTFNAAQISALERIFKEQQYPDQALREKIAERLEMEEHKVVIWFQNRRAKLKRNNANLKNTLVTAPIQDTICLERVQTIDQHSVLGGNSKWESQHVNASDSYTVNQQNSLQDSSVPVTNSYHFDKPTPMLHGIPEGTVCSSLQENYTFSNDTGCANDVRRSLVQLASDGITSSPEPVAVSMDSPSDTGDVSSALKPIPTLKPDKPLIQEPPPNQICTNAGCQDEMRQALMQWRTKLNMAATITSQQQTINSSTSLSSGILNTSQNKISAHVDRSFQFQTGIYEDTCMYSSSSTSCSESDEDENCLMNQRNKQFPYKFHPPEHHKVDSSNTQQYRTFNSAPALNQQDLLYLDIPSVSSSDMSSPAPHSTTSSTSWLSSDLSSVDLSSPLSQLDNQKPVPQINMSGPMGFDWSSKCNETPNKPTYISHVTNPYAGDIFLPPLRRDVEMPTQRSRRRVKWRRIRHEQRRKYPVRTNKHNKNSDKYMYYPGSMEMHIKRQDRCMSMEGIAHTGQREPFTSDNFISVPGPNTTRSQCKYAQQDSAYIEQQYEQPNHNQRQSNGQSKRRHLNNHRLHCTGNLKYSQHHMPNQNMMPTTAEELRSATRIQKSDNGLDENYSSSSNNNTGDVIPSNQNPLMIFNGGNSARDGKSLDQHRNRAPYSQATPEWNNPIMEVHVPVHHHRRPKQPQPTRAEKGATSGVVHHYGGDEEELDIPPLQVESVSDLSSSLNADQSAVLNRVLESVVKDIFPFSDNFISI